MKPAPALASARVCEPRWKSVVGLGMASREEERIRLGSALDCDARSVGGEEEMFAPAMRATPMLTWSPAAASDSESKSVVGLRSVRCERARERLGTATEARDPMAGPVAGGRGDEEKVDGDTGVEVGVSTGGRVMSEVGHWAKGGEPR